MHLSTNATGLFPNTTFLRFVGWWRPNRHEPWRKVCSAGDRNDCWDLLDAVERGGDKFVGPAGMDPNEKPVALRRAV